MAVKKPIIAKNSNAASARRSATTDHVEDVPLGELTQLNTTEFKFYGFIIEFGKSLSSIGVTR